MPPNRRKIGPKTAGKALVLSLSGLLEPGFEFDEAENHLLTLIELETDRAAAMRDVLAVELAKDDVSTRRVSEISAEIRQLEKQAATWCESLRPKETSQKSFLHQKAANSRWKGLP